MIIKAAIKAEGDDDSTYIVLTMKEEEARHLVRAIEPELNCDCTLCGVGSAIQKLLEKLSQ